MGMLSPDYFPIVKSDLNRCLHLGVGGPVAQIEHVPIAQMLYAVTVCLTRYDASAPSILMIRLQGRSTHDQELS
jgi:hypothetical protein